jgi:hypothetical protein
MNSITQEQTLIAYMFPKKREEEEEGRNNNDDDDDDDAKYQQQPLFFTNIHKIVNYVLRCICMCSN